MNKSSVSELAKLISRSLISASKQSITPRTWTPSMEQTLHRLGCRDSLTPSFVARVIDPLLLKHHSLALGFFNWASQQPGFSHSSISYNAVLKSLTASRHFSVVDQLFKQLRAKKIVVDPSIYCSIISSQLMGRKPLNAFSIFNEVSALNCDVGPDICNSLLGSLSADGQVTCARKMFDEMIKRGVVLSTLGFGVFIWKFCKNADVGEILSLIDEAKRGVWRVNGSIVAVLIVHGLCLEKRVQNAFWILDELRKRDCKPDFMAYRTVAEAFRLNGSVVDVEVALKKKRKLGVAPRANDYREFLFALISEKRFWEARELGEIVTSGNFPIEDDVLNALIGSISFLYPSSAMMFFKFMVDKERFPTLFTLTNFSRNLCKHNRIDDMLEVFQNLSSKEYFSDVRSYSVMVSLLCKAGRVKEAYEVIQVMKKKGLSPDVSIYNHIMEACCREGLVRPAKRLWDEMFTSGCSGDLKTYNILIKKFSEMGQVEESRSLFSHMLEKGVVPDTGIYSSLLKGFCKEKRIEDALEIFSKHVQQDPLLARSLLNTFIISMCEEGFFRAASNLLCCLSSGIGESGSHVILLKWLAAAGDVPLATEHVKWVEQNSPILLQDICRELRAASIPSSSNPVPILQLLGAIERMQEPVISQKHVFSHPSDAAVHCW